MEFLAFQIWIVFFQFDQLPYVIFPALFTFLGVSFVLFYFNWEIVIKPDGFVFRNSLRVKREYRFFDVTVEESSYRASCELVVRKRSNDRRICAIYDCFMDNYEAFGRAYRAYLKEKGITIKAKNSDTVRRSGALCVMVVLLCASLSGMLVWMTFSFKPKVWLMTFIAVPLPFVAVWWVLNYANWRVELKPEGFVFRNSLRVEREYRFSSVVVSVNKSEWVVARVRGSGKRICSVLPSQRNQMALLKAYKAYLQRQKRVFGNAIKGPK
jgi:hypothetical protein